jgi:hypothetical protein
LSLSALAWVEIKASAMKIDSRREVRRVAEAARFAFDAHDLAVEPFGHAVGDRVLDEPEHTVEVSLERGRNGLNGIELRADRLLPDGPWVFTRTALTAAAASGFLTRVALHRAGMAVPCADQVDLDLSTT